MRRTLACALAITLFSVSSGWCRAADGPAVIGYLPSDAEWVVLFRVKKIMESRLLAPVCQDAATASAMKEWPVDPGKIEEFILAAVPWQHEPEFRGPQFCPIMILRSTGPVDGKTGMRTFDPAGGRYTLEDRTYQGKTYYVGRSDLFYFQPDERTVAVARQEETIKGLISGDAGKGPMAEKLQAAGTGDEVVAVILLEPMRDVIKQARAKIPPQAMTMLAAAELTALPDQLKSATLTVNLSSPTLAKATLECTSAASGQKVSDTLKKALDGAKPLAGMAVLMAHTSPDTPPVAKEAMDVALRLMDGIKLAPAGDQVVVTVAKPKGLEQVVAMVPQAIAEARGAAGRAMRLNNLKQIGLAMLNYENAKRQFPTNICDKQGKPLLSWRVAIVPYLDDDAVYKQFHLDEPWDSPNNKKLLDRMPAVYQGSRIEKDGKTTIMVFTGKGSPFEAGKELSLAGITDGTSVTIMAVEAGPDKAVPWTKPEDLPFEPKDPRAALGKIPPSGFLAVMFDGSAHVLRSDISAETLARLINPRDGQRVDFNEAEVRPRPKARASFGPPSK